MSSLAVLLLALGAGGLMALTPDIALPLTILLLPGLTALVLDRSPGCGIARAVLLFQTAACIHPVSTAWYSCAGVGGCMDYLADWSVLLPVWMAGAVGWILTQALPLGLRVTNEYRARHLRAILIARRQALVEEWGLKEE